MILILKSAINGTYTMFTHNDYKNQFNILISLDTDKPHVFVKITDKLNYAVYTSTVDTLGLQSLMVCQNHPQLYNILEKSFQPPSNVSINITNTCVMNIHCQLSPDYHLDFSITLEEQLQTTEKMNQTLLLDTTKQYDDKIKQLSDKINKLESVLTTQNAALEYQHQLLNNATVFIGVANIRNNAGHYHYVSMMIPMGKTRLRICPGDDSSHNIDSCVKQMNPCEPGELKLINVQWKAITTLPRLTHLDIQFNNNSKFNNENEFCLKAIANSSITNLTFRQYPNATMDGLEKFVSLKELHVNDTTALKSLHQYLPPSIDVVRIDNCKSLIEAEKPSLEHVCNTRNIHLIIDNRDTCKKKPNTVPNDDYDFE